MESFNENFGNFITECRNNALEELKSNKRYNDFKQATAEIRSKLSALINPEAQELFDRYIEALAAEQSMEHNTLILCGLTISAEIQKRFDASTAEYKAFEEEYL